MHFASNNSGMPAQLSVSADKTGRDHCVVVIKGTYNADDMGNLTLAPEQLPLVMADQHYGDPERTCVRYESDFALEKPFSEVLVDGKAVAASGRPVTQLRVRLEIEQRVKEALVIGDRTWTSALGRPVMSDPQPFIEMPLSFDRAFGGQDDSHGPDRVVVERRNLHGVGFNPKRRGDALQGGRLPNLERPAERLTNVDSTPVPIGFGVVARNSAERLCFAGTYDAHWLAEVCPFLPADFDTRYFMSAPQDQWFPYFQGGERLRCIHMASRPQVDFILPRVDLPVRFRFKDHEVTKQTQLDTVIVTPHMQRAQLCWRSNIPLGKKLTALREVHIGAQAAQPQVLSPVGKRNGKPVFRGLSAAIQWIERRRSR